MNQIRPDSHPVPQRRNIGIDWDAVYPPSLAGLPAPYGDGEVARVLGCGRGSPRAARAARGILAAECPYLRMPVREIEALRARILDRCVATCAELGN